MLGPIRKFSSTIYAKVLLIIIIIPFIFWGMGGITSGNKNIIVMIDKDKYTTQEFADFIKRSATEKVKSDDVEGRTKVYYTWNGELLGNFPSISLHTAWEEQGNEVLTWLYKYINK